MMLKEHILETLRPDPLHDRPGLLGRQHRPARGREHLPGPARRPDAAVQLPGHVDDGERGDRLRAADALLEQHLAAALGRRGAAHVRVRAPVARELPRLGARLRLRPVDEPVADEHDHRLRRAGRAAVQRRRRTPTASAAPSPTTRSRSGAGAQQDGFAKRPADNIGIQYGLNALNGGLITTEQFVDLNEKIGGFDIDWQWQPRPHAGRPGRGRDRLPDRRGDGRQGARERPDHRPARHRATNEIHTDFHSHELRARLDKANGHHDNQVIWTSPVALAGDPVVELRWRRRPGHRCLAPPTARSWSWTTGSRGSRPTARAIRCPSRCAATSRRWRWTRAGSAVPRWSTRRRAGPPSRTTRRPASWPAGRSRTT